MHPSNERLAALSRGFREKYLTYDELSAQVNAWADAFPDLVRLSSIGTTPEGRALWMLTIGPSPERVRPAVWIDGNMHAQELAGSSAALAIAEDVLRVHLAPDAPLHGLGEQARAALRDVLFYVLPRMSPDGAERLLSSGAYVRSVPRDDRPNKNHPRWVTADVDGDGLALTMRVVDPTGEYVEAKEAPGLLVPRRIDDEGPFYKVYPEGYIEGFDGTIPTPSYVSDNDPDLNRNFPWSWAPDHEQLGAGRFPMSEIESRAVVETVTAHPNIFAWLNLHTFGGVFIRPLGHAPDNKMDPDDLALFRQIAEWNEQHTGYPTVSGFEEFTYEPDKPLHGDLTDFAYHQRGCIAYVCELWDLFTQIGMKRPKRFVDHYSHLTRDDMIALARFDAERNGGRVMRPWKRVPHPQLGEVEVGGIDPRIGLVNPPYERIDEVVNGQSAAFLRVAAMAPRVVIAGVRREPIGGDVTRVDVTIENHGYLPTYVLASAKKLSWNEPLWAEVKPEGCELAAEDDARREVGHLDGWGRGLFHGGGALYHLRSRGRTGGKTLRWVVKGHGVLVLRVGSCRTGTLEQRIEI